MIKLVTVANPREQTTRVGTEKDYSTDSIPEEYLKTHIPEKVEYSLENILQDLLNFSADRLSLGGRLVYWIPIIRQAYKVSEILDIPPPPPRNYLFLLYWPGIKSLGFRKVLDEGGI